MNLPIKVISLERSVDRRTSFSTLNEHIDFEFVSAVDGQMVSENILNDDQLFQNPLPFLTKGAIGCALSHLNMWDLVIKTNVPLTIAEDDAIFRRDFLEESNHTLSRLPPDWDVILWGWNFDSILSVRALPNIAPIVMLSNQKELRKNVPVFIEQETPSFPIALDKCFGTPAYSISPNGARKFKSLCFPMKNIAVYFPFLNKKIPNTGIDISMNKIYSSTNSFVAFPPLVITKNEHEISTIQNRS